MSNQIRIIMGSKSNCVGVEELTIEPRFTRSTIYQAAYYSRGLAVMVVDIVIGIIDKRNDPLTVKTEIVTVPRASLLVGRKYDSIRTIRFNHMMNILYAAVGDLQPEPDENYIITFMGFQPGE